uniref:Protein kinase domain-containing protein n=1 Tax=Caenorhabditis tropicalis TaxID=1561998 RepID=A0A1I7U1W6_9PELO
MVTRKQFISCDVPNGHSYLYLYEMAEILGPIPKAPFNYRMRPKYHDFFEEEDFIDHGNPDTHKIFVDAATKHNYLNAKDAECFSKFVSRFFEYDPKERVTAKEALDHDFLLTNEDKSVKIETADRPGTLSVDSSEASTSQSSSSVSGN